MCVWAIVPDLHNGSSDMNHSHKSFQLYLSTSTYSAIFYSCPCRSLTRHFVCCCGRTWWGVSWRLLVFVLKCCLLFSRRIRWNSSCYYCCRSLLEFVTVRPVWNSIMISVIFLPRQVDSWSFLGFKKYWCIFCLCFFFPFCIPNESCVLHDSPVFICDLCHFAQQI